MIPTITVKIPGKPITANMQARLTAVKVTGSAGISYRGRMYKSNESRAYQSLVYNLAYEEAALTGWKQPFYAVVHLRYYNIRADVDGVPKLILDGLQGVLYPNDSRIKRFLVEPFKDDGGERCEVDVSWMTWAECKSKGLTCPVKYRI